ncbi:hypothetical protein [Desulfofundulus kuznetsovii]
MLEKIGGNQMAIVGQRYAYRERARMLGEPVVPVIVVKEGPPRSRKVRIRHLDGEYEGFEEWVPKSRLVAPWEEVNAFCDDERRLLNAVKASGDVQGSIIYKAAEEVFGAIAELFGEELIFFGWKAIEQNLIIIKDFEKSVHKLGLGREELLSEPHAFIDRYGDYKAPFHVSERVVKDFCKRFPKEILRYIQLEENKLRQEAISASTLYEQEFAEEWLVKKKPVFALVREWCGEKALAEFNEVAELRKEIRRLQALIEATARWLKDAGHPVKASLLLKELRRATNCSEYEES